MKVTVFGGAGEIGGNQILLEGRESKIFLDFGKNFARESRYFEDPYLIPRKPQQLYELGLLPNLPGLYPWQEEEPEIAGILLSHAHLDHMDYARYTKQEIPLWAGEGTWSVIFAREIIGRRKEEERLAKFEDRGSVPFYKCFAQYRPNLMNFRTGREVKVGEFTVRPVHVDHSILASYGFVLEGPEGKISYTGDLRFHGPKNFSEDFLKEAEGCDVLIMEGTNVLESRPFSEGEVREKVEKIVTKTKGLVATSFASMDIDRLRTFFEVADKHGRILVLSTRQAVLLEYIRQEIEKGPVDFPFKLGDPRVKIYGKEKENSKWEQKLKSLYETVNSSWVSQNQEKVLLFATYYDMLELLSIKPNPGSVFIYSESEPLN
ncbi:MAG: MBL fold metallo-hydrolase, partial [Candidatus Hadarchaeales archaeon]